MGLFSWLFPSPADHVAKARKFMDQDRFAEARLELLDVDHPEVGALLEAALKGLVTINLDKAVEYCRAGDDGQCDMHWDRAKNFAGDDQPESFETVGAQLTRIRASRDRSTVWRKLTEAARRRADLGPEPGDFTWMAFNGDGAAQLVVEEDAPFGLPRLHIHPDPAHFRLTGLEVPKDPKAAPTAAQLETAHGALLAAYGETFREAVEAAGESLAKAVLALVAATPERAVPELVGLTDNAPARFELGRAACALGQMEAADLAFAEFAEMAGGHRKVGELHSAALHAEVAAHQGELDRAWTLIGEAGKGGTPHLYVAIALESGHFREARAALDMLVKRNNRDDRLPQLETALTLRETFARLADSHPILKGEFEGTPDERDAEFQIVQAEIGRAVNAALAKLPVP